uniref:Uncharacterized protein n=1 Tax=Romanomermis culicivorax TaxID=13658 RepID=A0A915JFH8_ROMCU
MKVKSQEEKNADTKKALLDKSVTCCSFDLQIELSIPCSQISQFCWVGKKALNACFMNNKLKDTDDNQVNWTKIVALRLLHSSYIFVWIVHLLISIRLRLLYCPSRRATHLHICTVVSALALIIVNYSPVDCFVE